MKIYIFDTLKNKIFKSSTLMTWFSFSSKILNILFVLPLILKNFNENELSVYFLFITIIATSNLLDFGFKSTFVRVFSFANAGLDSLDIIKDKPKVSNYGINWSLTERIFSSMKKIYIVISIMLILILSTFGTFLVTKSINLNLNPDSLWVAWIVIVITTAIGFYGKVYVCYLEGFNQIALIRKVEGYFSFITVFSKLVVLYYWPNILALIIVEKIWIIINLYRNIYLSKNINENKISTFKSWGSDITFRKKLFSLAWKNGMSSFLTIGLTNFTGLIYAQIGNTSSVNSYLFALRILNLLRDFSKGPFYSKIPLLSKLRAEGKISELVLISKRNMTLSNGIFLIGSLLIGVFSNNLLNLISSNVNFIDYDIWILLSIAYIIQRYSGMHMQLYLTTNHIISHIVDLVSGIIFIIFTLICFGNLGLYSIPISMIISYLCFSTWVSAKISLKSIKQTFWEFDRINFFLFLIITSIQIIISFV